MTDPKPRPDGTCVVCQKPRKKLVKKGQGKPMGRYATERDFATDPFCSRVCCEAYFETAPTKVVL